MTPEMCPLTDEQLEAMWEADTTSAEDCASLYFFKTVARAVERAHGIAGVAIPAAFSTAKVRAMAEECGVSGTIAALYKFAVAAAALGVAACASNKQNGGA
jgi:predicted xylose isomerase-like sugar epimerase